MSEKVDPFDTQYVFDNCSWKGERPQDSVGDCPPDQLRDQNRYLLGLAKGATEEGDRLRARVGELEALVKKQRESAQLILNHSIRDGIQLLTDALEVASLNIPDSRLGPLSACRDALKLGRQLLAIVAPTEKA